MANHFSVLAWRIPGTGEPGGLPSMPAARARLARTLGRKWSLGYYTPQSAGNLIKYDSLGVSGLLCGKVIATTPNGFTVSAGRPFFEGDMIRVQPQSGDEGPSFRITKMSVRGHMGFVATWHVES